MPILREAFAVASSGVPGPVFVEFPIDTLYPYAAIVKELVPPVCYACSRFQQHSLPLRAKTAAALPSVNESRLGTSIIMLTGSLVVRPIRSVTQSSFEYIPGAFDPQPSTPLPVDVPHHSDSQVC